MAQTDLRLQPSLLGNPTLSPEITDRPNVKRRRPCSCLFHRFAKFKTPDFLRLIMVNYWLTTLGYLASRCPVINMLVPSSTGVRRQQFASNTNFRYGRSFSVC